MAALPGLKLLAHGGVGGTVVEVVVVLGVAAALAAVWLRSRRSGAGDERSRDDDAQP